MERKLQAHCRSNAAHVKQAKRQPQIRSTGTGTHRYTHVDLILARDMQQRRSIQLAHHKFRTSRTRIPNFFARRRPMMTDSFNKGVEASHRRKSVRECHAATSLQLSCFRPRPFQQEGHKRKNRSAYVRALDSIPSVVRSMKLGTQASTVPREGGEPS